jgi:hypothetical protein
MIKHYKKIITMRHLFFIALITSVLIIVPNAETFAQRPVKKTHYAQNVKKKKVVRATYKHRKYTKLPKWGARVTKLHAKASLIKWKEYNYYFHSGVYYRKVNNKYSIVHAPIGIRVAVLPVEAARIVVRSKPYYYYYGTFYIKQKDNTYETTNPPIGAKVEILPDGLEEVTIEGETMYKLEDIAFKPELSKDGKLKYEVIRVE